MTKAAERARLLCERECEPPALDLDDGPTRLALHLGPALTDLLNAAPE
nr:hypothetical protein [Actinoplanes polyasparticus]